MSMVFCDTPTKVRHKKHGRGVVIGTHCFVNTSGQALAPATYTVRFLGVGCRMVPVSECFPDRGEKSLLPAKTFSSLVSVKSSSHRRR